MSVRYEEPCLVGQWSLTRLAADQGEHEPLANCGFVRIAQLPDGSGEIVARDARQRGRRRTADRRIAIDAVTTTALMGLFGPWTVYRHSDEG